MTTDDNNMGLGDHYLEHASLSTCEPDQAGGNRQKYCVVVFPFKKNQEVQKTKFRVSK